jgi:hypothetical protein
MRALRDALDLAQAPGFPNPLPSRPALAVDGGGNRAAALEYLEKSIAEWRANGLPEESLSLQRQTLAWRTLNTLSSRANMLALRTALDRVHAPRP